MQFSKAKKNIFLAAAALSCALALAGCDMLPRLFPSGKSPSSELSFSTASQAASSSSQGKSESAAASVPGGEEEGPVIPEWPEKPEEVFRLVEFTDQPITNGEYFLQLKDQPTSEAELVVCNAWMAEISAEYWRWDFLYAQFPREPDLGMPVMDSLKKGFKEGYCYAEVTINQLETLSAEQLYPLPNGKGDEYLLLPFYTDVVSTLPYEGFVDEFLAQGNIVVKMVADALPAPALLKTEYGVSDPESFNRKLVQYYVLKLADNNRLMIQNTTNKKGSFVVVKE